jgi:N-acetylglucosamine kinase-like BadF-type ATPase
LSADELVLGVDGGMTKTVALVARRDGHIVGYARGPGSNLYAATPEESVSTIVDTAATAATMAGTELADLVAAGLSLSGADCVEDLDYLTAQAKARALGSRRLVVNDSIGALYAAFPTGAGAVAVCGTGFTASARSQSGRRWFGGHWTDWASSRKRGFLGGQAMAEAAVRAVVDEALGLGPVTDLTPRLLESFQVDEVDEILHAVTLRGVHHPLLRVDVTVQLLLAANESDPVALSIVMDFGAAMGDLVGVAARLAGAHAEPLALSLMGSVLRAPCPPLEQSLLDAFASRVADFRLVSTPLEPAHGAVLIALELLGQVPTPAVTDGLIDSSPPRELFHTAAGIRVAGEMS